VSIMKRYWAIMATIGALALAPATAAAQAAVSWHKGTALAVFGGAATADGETDPAAGATASWEFTPYLTLEGSALWTVDEAVDTFSAFAGTRVNLLPRRTAVPFLSAGVGMHRATIEAGAQAPDFYAPRITARGPDSSRHEQAFDDFAVALGGGVELFIREHLSLRPDLRVLLVRGGGRTRPIAVYGVHLAYHFEDHPITP
jgi:hypothetical protein